MTGYGRGAVAEDTFAITVEMKTVNNRFLDVSLRLSSELQQLETTLKRIVANRLSRGRVDVSVQYDRIGDLTYELNRPIIGAYISAMKEMQEEFGLAGEPDLNVIARLPNVVQPK